MKFSHLISTIFLATAFGCILLFAVIFWFYSNADSKTLILLKDSLSTASGFFGGITTLIAAYIASRLFNDWKEQHNKQVLATEAKETFKLIHKERDLIHQLKFICEDISLNKSTKKISSYSLASDFENNLLNLFNKNKDIMTSFCFLSQGQDIFGLMLNYRAEIDKFAKMLSDERSKPFSQTTFLTSESVVNILELIKDIEHKNCELLIGLKTYIFVK